MTACSKVLQALEGKSLVTAESLTGGGIGAALTAVPGSSAVYKGGVICYTDWNRDGAVSGAAAAALAEGVRKCLQADVAVSVTGLAGPGGDDFGHPVGTVFIGYADADRSCVREFCFAGSREDVRRQTIQAALELILEFHM